MSSLQYPASRNFTQEKEVKASDLHIALLTTALVVILLLIMIGNLFVLVVLHRQRRNPNTRVANLLLACLAIVDLTLGILDLPFSIVSSLTQRWVFGDAGCQFNGFINQFVGGASILTMAVISIDRYKAIVSSPGHKLTMKQAWIFIAMVMLWNILVSLFPVMGWNQYTYNGSVSTVCKISFGEDKGYLLLIALTLYAIPLSVMLFCYLKVFLKVRNHRKNLDSWQRNSRENKSMNVETRTAKIVFTVLFVFIICWTPFTLVHLVATAPDVHIPHGVFSFVGWFAASHSAWNPIIYFVMNKKFRLELFDIVPCCFVGVVQDIQEMSLNQIPSPVS